MHSLFNTLVDIVPLRHKISIRKAQVHYMRLKKALRPTPALIKSEV